LEQFRQKRGISAQTDADACEYACETTGDNACAEIAAACVATAYLDWIPGVPVACGTALVAVCAGSAPACFMLCQTVK
jgi:hypothetical protein